MADEKRVNWLAVMTDYARGTSVAELSRRHHVSERMIRKRKAQDEAAARPWPKPEPARGVNPEARVDSHQSAGARDGGSGTARRSGGVVLEEGDFDGDAEVSDEQLARALKNAAMRMLVRWQSGAVEPGMNQSEADVFSAVIAGASRAIDKSRDVAGRKPGTPSTVTEEATDRPIRIMRRVIARPADAVSA